jgi:hypothetical protein
MRRTSIGYVVGAIFILVGAGFIWGGISMFTNDQRFAKIAVPGEGTILEINRSSSTSGDDTNKVTFYPVVRFETPDGKNVEFIGAGSSQPGYTAGQTVPVLYNPNQPNEARIKTSVPGTILTLIFPIVGLIALLIGVLTFISPIYSKRKKAWLQKNGQTITVPVLRVDKIQDSRGTPSYFIIGQWQNPNDQKVYIFSSEQIIFDPNPYVSGQQLQVLIDPNNPNRYHMDISFLPTIG